MGQDLNWKLLIRAGLIAGIVTLYTGLVGMLVAFSERQIIREVITLGQILLVAASLAVGFLTARRLAKPGSTLMPLVSGGVVEVDHAGFDPARTANAQIVRDRTELVGVAGGEKQHVMRGSKAAGGLVRDRRGHSTDQYAPWIAHEATRRQKLEEKRGSTYAQKARHSGKYWRKLCADMRASFAG